MNLNLKQIEEVAAFLRHYKQLSKTVQEELLDHLCCTIEDAMHQGASFEDAFRKVQGRWNESEVQKIHSSTQNQSFMIKLFLVASIAALLTFSPGLVSEQPVNVSTPFANQAVIIDPPNTCPLAMKSCDFHHGFGIRVHPITKAKELHKGVDYKAAMGTSVYAAGAGVVLEAGEKGHYGYCIIIQHDEMYQTWYAHLSQIKVQVGQTVSAGSLIGAVGSTGVSTGPHLHFEIRKHGEAVDPALYIP